jgi:hypothetical protein
MSKRKGPLRRVDVASRMGGNKEWQCTLECGHTVIRQVRHRWVRCSENPSIQEFRVIAPRWVYCEKCTERKVK